MRERWLQSTRRLLRSAGFHAGGARATLIDALACTGGGLTAPELYDGIREAGGSIGAASVYRVLTELEGVGAIRRVDLGQSQALIELIEPGGEHHHYIVCDACGATERFTDPLLEETIGRIEQRASFPVHAHDVILHGICAGCQPDVARRSERMRGLRFVTPTGALG